jgi:hypothetical protein
MIKEESNWVGVKVKNKSWYSGMLSPMIPTKCRATIIILAIVNFEIRGLISEVTSFSIFKKVNGVSLRDF